MGVHLTSKGGTLKLPALEELDYQRGTALHNHVSERGLQASEGSTANKKTWWELYGSSIDSLPQKLHPVVREFLKLAWVSWDGSSLPAQLFCNIGSIPSSDQLFSTVSNEAYRGLDTLDRDVYDELENVNDAEEDEYLEEDLRTTTRSMHHSWTWSNIDL